MKSRAIFLVSLFFVFVLFSGCGTAQKKTLPPAPKKTATKTYGTLAALAADDPYPNGCVSCHKKTSVTDRSLPAYVKRIEDHPQVKGATISSCYDCHEAQKNYSLYKKFYMYLHKFHWQSDVFYGTLKGQCFSCHTVEKNGVAGIKDYPLAGYRTSLGGKSTPPSSSGTKREGTPSPSSPAPAPAQPQEKAGQKTEQPQGEPSIQGQNETTSKMPTPGP